MRTPQLPEGTYVVVRSRDAGVHAGRLTGMDGSTVQLAAARRLWYWKCRKGDFLSGVARWGVSEESKVGGHVDIIVLGVCEVIACTAEAANSIDTAAEYGA